MPAVDVETLERYGLWSCARYAKVLAALSDWLTLAPRLASASTSM